MSNRRMSKQQCKKKKGCDETIEVFRRLPVYKAVAVARKLRVCLEGEMLEGEEVDIGISITSMRDMLDTLIHTACVFEKLRWKWGVCEIRRSE